jgi:hypothetical protein
MRRTTSCATSWCRSTRNTRCGIDGRLPRYLEKAPRDFITFEYVMLDGINDSDAHARELLALVKTVPCKFNLIPFNPFRARRSSVRRLSGCAVLPIS